LDSVNKFINSRLKILKILKICVILIYLFVFIWVLSMIVRTTFIHYLNTSFQQCLIIFSPYISDQDEKVYKSRWATMNSYNDFKEISKDIDDIAKQKNILLPGNKLK
jgi:hypothetical protein